MRKTELKCSRVLLPFNSAFSFSGCSFYAEPVSPGSFSHSSKPALKELVFNVCCIQLHFLPNVCYIFIMAVDLRVLKKFRNFQSCKDFVLLNDVRLLKMTRFPLRRHVRALFSTQRPVCLLQVHITQYADSVASHLAKILDSDKHSDVISSAKYVPLKYFG